MAVHCANAFSLFSPEYISVIPSVLRLRSILRFRSILRLRSVRSGPLGLTDSSDPTEISFEIGHWGGNTGAGGEKKAYLINTKMHIHSMRVIITTVCSARCTSICGIRTYYKFPSKRRVSMHWKVL